MPLIYLSSYVLASFSCLVHLKVCHFLVSGGRGGGGGQKSDSVIRGWGQKLAFCE